MRAVPKCWWTQKQGNQIAEYEDAHKVRRLTWQESKSRGLSDGYYFAVADGATESAYSGLWAKILCDQYVGGCFASDINETNLLKARRQWQREIPASNLPWFAEMKLLEGSYAALVGLGIFEVANSVGGYRAEIQAVGDCLIVHVGRDHPTFFPLTHSSQFNSRPFLVGTQDGSLVQTSVMTCSLSCEPKDTFFLMSDSLGCWLLSRLEEEAKDPRDYLFGRGESNEGFRNRIEIEREKGRMRNDDVTLLRIDIL